MLLLLALVAYVVKRLYDAGQFAYALWEPFVTPDYVRAILVDGLLDTLKMAFLAIARRGRLRRWSSASASSPTTRLVRWPCWLVVEFFRAVPVLMLMIFIFYASSTASAIEQRSPSGAWSSR